MWDRRKFIKLGLAGLIGGTGIYALLNNYRKNHVLDIVVYPDPNLRKVSKPIDRIDDDVISMANAMIDTLQFKAPFEFFLHASLYKGLSAPQIGIQKRLIVCGLYGEVRAMVNPKILEKKGSYDSVEYCMSLPKHRHQTVKRSNYVKIRYRGLDNREHILDAKDHRAALLEHEIDHLNGVLYIDHT
ncbi:MAG: Peptide deformylase (EC 3.5.1.88) [Olavius algarvensis Delta 4 endosymbiont]|nr:MAG: Peptide deformylase (EC 3.5.1.88) [Olavius algarvensis Delta 4 endosymbiont]